MESSLIVFMTAVRTRTHWELSTPKTFIPRTRWGKFEVSYKNIFVFKFVAKFVIHRSFKGGG